MPAKTITVRGRRAGPANRTIYRADQPWFADREAVLGRLQHRKLVMIDRHGNIRVLPGAVSEELDLAEREVVHRLLGYSWDRRHPLIAKRAGVVGGRAAMAGRRIPVWQIENRARSGLSPAQLAAEFDLSAEQVAQALAYAKRHSDEIDQDILDQETAAEQVAEAQRWVVIGGKRVPVQAPSKPRQGR